MKDETFNRQVARIQALTEKWLTPLGLKWWRQIDFEYSDERKEDSRGCAASTHVQPEYLQAAITFYLPVIETLSDADLEYCYVHECMHVLVNEMRWQDAKGADNLFHEERVCTTLARAFVWVRDFALDGRMPNASDVSQRAQAAPEPQVVRPINLF